MKISKLCQCKCGEYAKPGNSFLFNHHRRGAKHTLITKDKIRKIKLGKPRGVKRVGNNLCQCGCGEYCVNKYFWGHEARIQIRSEETKQKQRQKMLGHEVTEHTRNLIRQKANGRKHTKEAKEKNRIASLGNKYAVGIKHTAEGLERIRQSGIKRAEQGILFGRLINGGSYHEDRFKKWLESIGYIKDVDFFQQYHLGRYWLDFAFPNKKFYVEIDGSQHGKAERKAGDLKRGKWLDEQGWFGIRIWVKELDNFFKTVKIGRELCV